MGKNICTSREPVLLLIPPSTFSIIRALVRTLEVEDSSAMGSAPNEGNPVGHAPLEETESCKGGNFLDTPNHTPPRSKSPLPFSCHRGWAMGSGREVGREGGKSSTGQQQDIVI